MIQSFADVRTEKIFNRQPVKALSRELQRSALRKLLILNAATSINDLRVPPGNRLEKHKGDRKEYYGIRVDRQWRIVLRWRSPDSYDVELIDYH